MAGSDSGGSWRKSNFDHIFGAGLGSRVGCRLCECHLAPSTLFMQPRALSLALPCSRFAVARKAIAVQIKCNQHALV